MKSRRKSSARAGILSVEGRRRKWGFSCLAKLENGEELVFQPTSRYHRGLIECSSKCKVAEGIEKGEAMCQLSRLVALAVGSRRAGHNQPLDL